MISGLFEIILVLGCLKLLVETDDWRTAAAMYCVASVALYLIFQKQGYGSFVQLVLGMVLSVLLFNVLTRVEGAAWFAVAGVTAILLIVF